MVSESNIDNGTQTSTEESQANYVKQAANETYYRAPSKVKGFLVYELLDSAGAVDNQAHYGLVHYTVGAPGTPGAIGPDKAAYGAYRSVIDLKR